MKYEYYVIDNGTLLGERLLNKLGEEEWELVSSGYNSTTDNYFYIFKREKVSPQDVPAVYNKRDNTTVEDIQRITKEIEEKEKKILELEEKRFNTMVEGLK